jgi:hypothetical protein
MDCARPLGATASVAWRRLADLKLAAIARDCPTELLGTVAQFAYGGGWRGRRLGLRGGRTSRGSFAGRPCWWLPKATVSDWRYYNTDTECFRRGSGYYYDEHSEEMYVAGVARLPHRRGYGRATPDDQFDTQASAGLWVAFVYDTMNDDEVALLDGIHHERKGAIEAAHAAAERAAQDEWDYREREREEQGEEEE